MSLDKESEVQKLLAEIDRLRSSNNNLIERCEELYELQKRVGDKVIKERDTLKIINDQDLSRIERLIKGRDALRVENEKLKHVIETSQDITCLSDLYLKQGKENQRLRVRIDKLRDALLVAHQDYMVSDMRCGCRIKKALSQDDEAAKS
jgi:regulator of replication initiation timing